MGELNQTNCTCGASDLTWSRIFVIAAVSPLICISVIGNVLIVVTKACRSPGSKSSYSMVLLGLCDLVKTFCFFCVYLQPLIWSEWILQPFACRVIPKLLLCLFSFTGMLTVLLMVERYLIIKHPFTRGMRSTRFTASVFLMIGIHASFFAPSSLFTFELTKVNDRNVCINHDHRQGSKLIFKVEVGIFVLLVVSSAMVMGVLLRLASQELRKKPSAAPVRNPHNQNLVSVYIMRSIYIAYVTSFLPWIVLYAVAAVDNQAALDFNASLWSLVLYWFVAGSFCNAFLTFSIFSRSFRAEMLALVCALPSKLQRRFAKHRDPECSPRRISAVFGFSLGPLRRVWTARNV